MFKLSKKARAALVVVGLATAFAQTALGEDFADWSDREVNAALEQTRLELGGLRTE